MQGFILQPTTFLAKIELLFDDEYLKEGGAATIAYAKLQFTYISDFEREARGKALLKYC